MRIRDLISVLEEYEKSNGNLRIMVKKGSVWSVAKYPELAKFGNDEVLIIEGK